MPEEQVDADSVPQGSFISAPTEGQGLSIVTRSGLLWDSQQEEAIERGQLVHDLFAKINRYEDLEGVVSAARAEGLFKKGEEEEVRQILQRVMEHPELAGFYSQGSANFNEKDIITGSGNILRPDRLNFNGNEVSIIDYKTGATSSSHQAQINGYSEVLSEMGFEVRQKYLVYINQEVSITSV